MKVITKDFDCVVDEGFLKAVCSRAGNEVKACYQCGKCSAGCPVGFVVEEEPHQIIRMVQLGLRDRALQSDTIWTCASCVTCSSRCPMEVDLAKVMDTLREMATERGAEPSQKDIRLFHQTFLNNIKRSGRSHEMSLIGEYKLRSGKLFSDLGLGQKLFLKGKLNPLPHGVKDNKAIKKIFGA